jgi:hypothetical protein
LVNLISRQSFAITKDKDLALANTIDAWFIDFEKNLRILFEDDSVHLDLILIIYTFPSSEGQALL